MVPGTLICDAAPASATATKDAFDLAARCVHKIGARLHELRLDQLVRPGTGELDAMVSMSNALRLLNLTGSGCEIPDDLTLVFAGRIFFERACEHADTILQPLLLTITSPLQPRTLFLPRLR